MHRRQMIPVDQGPLDSLLVEDGAGRPVKPRITIVLDTFTRLIVGFHITVDSREPVMPGRFLKQPRRSSRRRRK